MPINCTGKSSARAGSPGGFRCRACINTVSAATIFRGENMKTVQKISIAIILLTFVAAIYAYPLLPEKVASHWDMSGNANGYMGRGFGAFFMPVLGLLMLALFYALPLLDPMKKNYAAFRRNTTISQRY